MATKCVFDVMWINFLLQTDDTFVQYCRLRFHLSAFPLKTTINLNYI